LEAEVALHSLLGADLHPGHALTALHVVDLLGRMHEFLGARHTTVARLTCLMEVRLKRPMGGLALRLQDVELSPATELRTLHTSPALPITMTLWPLDSAEDGQQNLPVPTFFGDLQPRVLTTEELETEVALHSLLDADLHPGHALTALHVVDFLGRKHEFLGARHTTVARLTCLMEVRLMRPMG
jgi:hypothetical protein